MSLAGHSPRAPAWSSWYLTMPKLAVGLLVLLLVALLWLLRENEKEEQHATLIADVLWLEQSIRFHIEGGSTQLQQLALDLGDEESPEKLFDARARHLIRTSTELLHIAWLDAEGAPRAAQPGPDVPRRKTPAQPGDNFFELARKLGKPVFSRPFDDDGVSYFELLVPVYRSGRLAGMLVATHSLPALIGELVPWWFVQKYRMQILDDDGHILASKSKVAAGEPGVSHQVLLDPPGHGLTLYVAANRAAVGTAQALITALIIFLAGTVFWSLWAIRGQIRHRISAEQALRSEHAFRKAMEDSLTVGMRARDREGRITYVNPAFCEMTGFAADTLVGALPPYPYWNPDEIEQTHELHNRVLDGRAPAGGFELRFRRQNGEIFDALVYEAPLIDANGQHTGWMASVLDVTQRKRAEELARQQQEKLQATSRLVTMGELASTLAHELNQPLAAISGYNTGCLNRLASGHFDPAELRLALEKLGAQAERAGRIIQRVHDFVRKREPRFTECDLAEIVDDAVGFIEHFAHKRGVSIDREIPGWRPPLFADQVMIEQTLLNLMRNGIEAMSETPAARRRLSVRLVFGDDKVEVRIIDNGSGLADGVRSRLFTPFFSTRPDGMGMGLNICRSIIEFHRGSLWVEDNPQGGSIFVFTLPVSMRPEPVAVAVASDDDGATTPSPSPPSS
ncbi:MAG: PAS domain S-box protein [Azospira sp.]|nr:PAS domain S-box protein [Azospira sp.]